MSQTTLTMHPFPAIAITSPTPPRPLTHDAAAGTMNTPSQSSSSIQPPSYRLLYRGALSLPDSHLLLDGLTFAAKLDSPSKHNTFNLLQNPLALALESMRGRPTLRFMGVVQLRDVYVDESGGVELDVHPHATLTRIYFENIFCLSPFPTTSSTKSNTTPSKSDIGIKVALGDSNGPETTEIVIFAHTRPQTLLTPTIERTIQLTVGRLTAHPPVQQHLRLPRPDDPTPRKPPIMFGRDLKKSGSLTLVGGTQASSSSSARELKRVASGNVVGAGGAAKRQKLMRVGSVADLGSGVRLGGGAGSEIGVGQLFKIPDLPTKHVVKPKSKGKEKADVFGDVEEVGRVESKAKGKKKAEDNPQAGSEGAAAVEKSNKTLIKKATIAYLARTKDPTRDSVVIDKQHPEFKEFYGIVYRGVGYALRAKMKLGIVDSALVDRLVGMHVRMYLDGCGGVLDLPGD